MDWASITYPGTREINEDSVGIVQTQDAQCFIVADGLGGHGKGDVASQVAVAAFQKVFQESAAPLEERMKAAFLQAQQDILEQQKIMRCPMQMKTTVTALAVDGKQVLWGYIGDTRLYGFGHLWGKVRTLDHSVPQMLVFAKEIKEKEIRHHPDRNKLLRVLGVSGEQPRFEMSKLYGKYRFRAFLLCSDGFWEFIEDEEMRKCLNKAKTAQQWLEEMEKIVQLHGAGKARDNFSAIAVLL